MEKDPNLFDPVMIAKAEDEALGAGITGNYKRNIFTIINYKTCAS